MRSTFAVIAGGGTAGHVHPGLAVAQALVAKGHDPETILYVGTERGVETELVPEAGFELATVHGRGVPRTFSLAAMRAAGDLMRGTLEAARLLGQREPGVVLSLGGYAAVPCAVAARLRRIPVVIQEQNAVPGAANRLISRWAVAAAVSFPDTPLPAAVFTGNPVRPEISDALGLERHQARDAVGVDDQQFLIVITGGSLGALRLNVATLEAAEVLGDREDLVLRHVIGKRDWEMLEPRRAAMARHQAYQPIEYETDMPTVLAAADLVVSRAGASIVAELAVAGVPSVLVPLPGAPGDHQTANARALVDVGGALLIKDADFTGETLVEAVEDLVADPERLSAMGTAAASAGRVDAADRVAAMLEEHAA
ncbi:MAG: undecaprenyldiphospho-muramoylpentapeptide beta-N-acetylglucosaminyltransferase [Acidimicrobiales bacterium]